MAGGIGFSDWLGLLVKSRIWFRQELDFRKHTQSVAAADGTIADVMLAVRALRLNNDSGKVLCICVNDGAMGQADVNVNRSYLVCVSEEENGPTILHILLDCHATAKTRCLLPMFNVNFVPQRIVHAVARPNENKISHRRRGRAWFAMEVFS